MQKLVILSLFVLFFSCKKESAVNNQTDNQTNNQKLSKGTWPIVPGNYWVYRDSLFNNDGTFRNVVTNDTFRTSTSVTFNGQVFYGPYDNFGFTYYRQVDDSTTEVFGNDFRKQSNIIFRQVKNNNTVIWSKEEDGNAFFNGAFNNYHSVNSLTGFTDITSVNGYDCIRNEAVLSWSGTVGSKTILYVKPGVGLVRLLQYNMKNQSLGDVYLTLKMDLLSYKLK